MHDKLSFHTSKIKVKIVYGFKNLRCGLPVLSLKGAALFHLSMQGI